MTIALSKEELLSAHNNGTLEGLLLGHGILPMKVLGSVLEEETSDVESLSSQITSLEEEVDSLLEQIADLEDCVWSAP